MTKNHEPSEQAVQRAVCQHLRRRSVSGLVWWHTPNGGRRSRVEAAIFAGLGVKPGVADLILLHGGRPFALELKTERGRPTAAQMQFLSEFRAAGGEASIANGLDQALRVLETWGLLRGRAASGPPEMRTSVGVRVNLRSMENYSGSRP
jgi:hypothetical protein